MIQPEMKPHDNTLVIYPHPQCRYLPPSLVQVAHAADIQGVDWMTP